MFDWIKGKLGRGDENEKTSNITTSSSKEELESNIQIAEKDIENLTNESLKILKDGVENLKMTNREKLKFQVRLNLLYIRVAKEQGLLSSGEESDFLEKTEELKKNPVVQEKIQKCLDKIIQSDLPKEEKEQDIEKFYKLVSQIGMYGTLHTLGVFFDGEPKLFGKSVPVNADALIGLLPGPIDDGILAGLLFVVQEYLTLNTDLGLRNRTKHLAYHAIDAVVGFVPLVGNAADAFLTPNKRITNKVTEKLEEEMVELSTKYGLSVSDMSDMFTAICDDAGTLQKLIKNVFSLLGMEKSLKEIEQNEIAGKIAIKNEKDQNNTSENSDITKIEENTGAKHVSLTDDTSNLDLMKAA